MFKVVRCWYDDLTDEEKNDVPNNGYGGKEEANYLRLIHNDETYDLISDAMEPEDATFTRDLFWVKAAIEQAYELGYADGKLGEWEKIM